MTSNRVAVLRTLDSMLTVPLENLNLNVRRATPDLPESWHSGTHVITATVPLVGVGGSREIPVHAGDLLNCREVLMEAGLELAFADAGIREGVVFLDWVEYAHRVDAPPAQQQDPAPEPEPDPEPELEQDPEDEPVAAPEEPEEDPDGDA